MNNIQEILQKAKEGDSEAFGLLYKEYYTPIYRYIYARVKDPELTKDLAQDVFIKIYKGLGSYVISGNSPLSYFYTTARNTLIDHWRKKTVETVGDDDFLQEIPDTQPVAEVAAGLKERSAILTACLDHLTVEQKEVITLRFMDELSTAETATIMGKAETAVRQLQVRALRTLAKLFKEKYT